MVVRHRIREYEQVRGQYERQRWNQPLGPAPVEAREVGVLRQGLRDEEALQDKEYVHAERAIGEAGDVGVVRQYRQRRKGAQAV